MPMAPTVNHPLFDGTQIILGPLKLGATYLGNALVWVAGCFAIATIEVPLALEDWFNCLHSDHHMLNQDMKLSAHPIPMP